MQSIFSGQVNCDGQLPLWVSQRLSSARFVAGHDRIGILMLYEAGEDGHKVIMDGEDFIKLVAEKCPTG